MDSTYIRSPELLSRTSCRLLIVDVQKKLLPHVPVADELVATCRRLIEGANILGIPVTATEQYPQGLGPTTGALANLLPERPQKLRFSAAEVLSWPAAANVTDDREQVVVAGLEAHVCVMQTVLDLIAAGWRVYVAADAVASRRKLDWKHALRRMADAGAVITTAEAILFEWCEAAGTPEFKQISGLVTGRAGTTSD